MEHITDNLSKLSINNNDEHVSVENNKDIYPKSAYKTGNKEFYDDAHSQQFTVKELSEKYDLTVGGVRNWLNRRNITPKYFIYQPKFNINFFLNYTEELAYVLGWLAADGNIKNERRMSLRLKNTDSCILKCIKALTGHTSPVKYGKQYDERTDKINNYCFILFDNENVIKEMKKYKLTPAKSLTLEYPDLENYESHFIRGYLTGMDGFQK